MGDTLNMVLIAIYKPRVCHSGTETWDGGGGTTSRGGSGGWTSCWICVSVLNGAGHMIDDHVVSTSQHGLHGSCFFRWERRKEHGSCARRARYQSTAIWCYPWTPPSSVLSKKLILKWHEKWVNLTSVWWTETNDPCWVTGFKGLYNHMKTPMNLSV